MTARAIEAEPDTLLAARLAARLMACEDGAGSALIFVARSNARAARVAAAVAALAPDAAALHLPAWDCLPFDRASPSASAMGPRMDALWRLTKPGPRLLAASPDALLQRLPPPERARPLALREGDPLDPDAIVRALERRGYAIGEDADAPGEAAIGAAVLDVFPAAGGAPLRIRHADGVVTGIDRLDAAALRSVASIECADIGPASELVFADDASEAPPREPGAEHALATHEPALVSPFDLLARAPVAFDPEVDEIVRERLAQLDEARAARSDMLRLGEHVSPVPPDGLYLDAVAWARALKGRERITLSSEAEPRDPHSFRRQRDPQAAALAFIGARLEAGDRVMVAGRRIARAAEREFEPPPIAVASWTAFQALPSGTLARLAVPLAGGFVVDGCAVLADDDVYAPRAHHVAGFVFDTTLRPGDAVIHLDHGMAALRGLETVADEDVLSLEFAGGKRLLVPAAEINRVWRYGSEVEAVTLDRFDGDAWRKRRAEIEAEIAASADRLVGIAAERAAATAPVIRPPAAAMRRFDAGFPYAPTSDQAEAIEAVMADLRAGRPMDRLICGDVGFGKTEVALRAAAAVALAGRQVAVVAPTTVLVRQHAQTFARRFAALGIAIGALSRLTPPADAKRVRAGLADGSLRVVVGTQALAAKTVRMPDLGLLIVDEEQRFGVKQKEAHRRLGTGSGNGTDDGVHVLTLTATPIPRTLQGALAGLQDVSLLTTPPARRQPVRTLVLPFDAAVARNAIARERRRGGQTFVVCPRVEDLAPMGERLRAAIPGLRMIEAHGGLPAAELDAAMTRFADGDGDVLLSTDIIESGLDIPRANTMLVWRADRFGLAQLHQLRGRVGRGRLRGGVWLFTDPDAPPGSVAAKRLAALAAEDRLGAGFAIAARDLDLRGAGDLVGADQAGHVKLIGLELYRHLLTRALATARGDATEEEWSPDLVLPLPAFLPAETIPNEAARIELHGRLSRGEDPDALADEIEDRFGPLPPPVVTLLARARLARACRRLGVARLSAGPQGASAVMRGPAREVDGLERRGDTLLLPVENATADRLVAAASSLLRRIAATSRRP